MQENAADLKELGFTLVEFLFVTVILVSLIAIAGLQYPQMLKSFDRNNSRTSFEFDIRKARSRALEAGQIVVVEFDLGGTGYSFGNDVAPINDPLAFDSSAFRRQLPNSISITSNKTLAFDSRGFLVDANLQITTAEISLQQDGAEFCSIELFPTGEMEADCA
jgi:Tfp pilus assembly protein FimT